MKTFDREREAMRKRRKKKKERKSDVKKVSDVTLILPKLNKNCSNAHQKVFYLQKKSLELYNFEGFT